jgi:hypothetical protein
VQVPRDDAVVDDVGVEVREVEVSDSLDDEEPDDDRDEAAVRAKVSAEQPDQHVCHLSSCRPARDSSSRQDTRLNWLLLTPGGDCSSSTHGIALILESGVGSLVVLAS